jgi:hypothetical protein
MLKLVTWGATRRGSPGTSPWFPPSATISRGCVFGVMRRESHVDPRTAVVFRVLRRLPREKQRCDLGLQVGFGAGTHRSKHGALRRPGWRVRADRRRSVHVSSNYRFLGLENPDAVVGELRALGV